jgi:hypothetical protein
VAVDLSVEYVITAPSATDGRGEVAVLNNSASGNFVGYLFDSSGFESPEVRESFDEIVEGDGAVHGSFYHGRRPFTLDILVEPAATGTLSMARLDKLLRATNAMRADGSIVWTETGGVSKTLNFRRQQPVRGPSQENRCLFAGVSADPRIYATTATTGSSPTTNAGTVGSPPTFTLTPTGSNVVITNTTTSQALTLTVGTGGVATGSAVTVNFGTHTVTQGGVSKYEAVVFPTSVWWEIVPGSNSWTVTNASSVSISVRSAWL